MRAAGAGSGGFTRRRVAGKVRVLIGDDVWLQVTRKHRIIAPAGKRPVRLLYSAERVEKRRDNAALGVVTPIVSGNKTGAKPEPT